MPFRLLVASLIVFGFSPSTAGAQTSRSAGASPEQWRAIVTAAQKEGKVVLYGNPFPALVDRIKADFQAAHPEIKLEVNRIVGTTLISTLEQERKAGLADGADVVFAPEITWFEKISKEGLVSKPIGPSAANWPQNYMVGLAPVLSIAPFVMAYNTNLVKTPITGYEDLLRPEFKGKLGTPEPIAESIVAWYDWLAKTYGDGFIGKFSSQSPKSFAGSFPAIQSLAAGEIAITAYTVPTQALALIKNGAPIKIVVPNPCLGLSYAGAILGWAKRPNAAQVFLDFLLSPRGQITLNGFNESASPLPRIPGSLDASTIKTYDAKLYTAEAVLAFQTKYKSQFQGN